MVLLGGMVARGGARCRAPSGIGGAIIPATGRLLGARAMRRADGASPVVGESAVGPMMVPQAAGPAGSGGRRPVRSGGGPGVLPAARAPAPQLRYSEYRGVDR